MLQEIQLYSNIRSIRLICKEACEHERSPAGSWWKVDFTLRSGKRCAAFRGFSAIVKYTLNGRSEPDGCCLF